MQGVIAHAEVRRIGRTVPVGDSDVLSEEGKLPYRQRELCDGGGLTAGAVDARQCACLIRE